MKLSQNELFRIAVHRYCDAEGINQERFAELMGITRQTLSRFMYRDPIPPSRIKQAADLMGMHISELTESEPETVAELQKQLDRKIAEMERLLSEKEASDKERQVLKNILDMLARQSK